MNDKDNTQKSSIQQNGIVLQKMNEGIKHFEEGKKFNSAATTNISQALVGIRSLMNTFFENCKPIEPDSENMSDAYLAWADIKTRMLKLSEWSHQIDANLSHFDLTVEKFSDAIILMNASCRAHEERFKVPVLTAFANNKNHH